MARHLVPSAQHRRTYEVENPNCKCRTRSPWIWSSLIVEGRPPRDPLFLWDPRLTHRSVVGFSWAAVGNVGGAR